jgi:iron complex outermembrane recepter protein
VTGRQQALANADERKKKAESSIDSIVADDAGKLPDSSIAEVLQRVSGVTLVRFGSLGDPDHFSGEGSGIQVRGLSGVGSRLNGREVFSSSSGHGISWNDITPEMMSAVDVYKSPTADLIEGGTGGQVDLRTKMPFDYADESVHGGATFTRWWTRKQWFGIDLGSLGYRRIG